MKARLLMAIHITTLSVFLMCAGEDSGVNYATQTAPVIQSISSGGLKQKNVTRDFNHGPERLS